MKTLPFDVNDEGIRSGFLYNQLVSLLGDLTERHQPAWGKLTATEMVEHLAVTFDISLGKVEFEIPLTEASAEKRRKFLYNNDPTPHEVINPLMHKKGYTFKLDHLDEAIQMLSDSVQKFRVQKNTDPDRIRCHPVFGYLNMVDWERAHYKHCYHHLLQFGLINPIPGNEA